MSGKLGNDNHRLLGTRNSSGPSPKFLEPSLSVSSHFSLRRRPIAYQLRDSRHAGKGSNSHSSLHSGESRVHQLTLFGPPKRRWSEASGEPDTPEPVPSLRTLQNGRNPHGKGPTKKRRFYGQDRSEGRIFPLCQEDQKFIRFMWEGTSTSLRASHLAFPAPHGYLQRP